MDTLANMRLFLRVIQAGSFSAAGRSVGLSPPTVFRMVNSLEDHLGARLLNRSSRRLTLTEAGSLYAARLESILGEIEEANTAVTQLSRSPRGTLRVHARVSLGVEHIAPLLPAFLAEHGDLRIDLRLSDTPLDLTENNLDIAVHAGDVSGSNLLVRRIAAGRRIVCASPRYLRSRGTPIEPDDLREHNCLSFRSEETEPRWRFRRRDEMAEIAVKGSLRTDSGQALHIAAREALGVVLLRTWSVGSDLTAGRLVRLLDDWEATPFGFDHDIHIVTQRSRHSSLKVRLFSEFLAKAFRKKEAAGLL